MKARLSSQTARSNSGFTGTLAVSGISAVSGVVAATMACELGDLTGVSGMSTSTMSEEEVEDAARVGVAAAPNEIQAIDVASATAQACASVGTRTSHSNVIVSTRRRCLDHQLVVFVVVRSGGAAGTRGSKRGRDSTRRPLLESLSLVHENVGVVAELPLDRDVLLLVLVVHGNVLDASKAFSWNPLSGPETHPSERKEC